MKIKLGTQRRIALPWLCKCGKQPTTDAPIHLGEIVYFHCPDCEYEDLFYWTGKHLMHIQKYGYPVCPIEAEPIDIMLGTE